MWTAGDEVKFVNLTFQFEIQKNNYIMKAV